MVLAAISAGERTVVPLAPVIAPPVVVPVSKEEVAQILDWQPRLLDFNSEPLAEVVATFNRRSTVRVIIGDEELRTLPIVASIRSRTDTPRHCAMKRPALAELRSEVEKHIKNSYLKRVDAPVGVGPRLVCWLELNEE